MVFCSADPKSYGNKTDQGKVECKVQQFSLNVEGRAHLNYEVLKTITFNEIRDPQYNLLLNPVMQCHAIHWVPKNYELSTIEKTKNHKLVYS